ncbi:hypothetical protein NPX13_g12 [Xylaria arbuscula]|uniref:Cyanovirin-N domain-containing protein n=1 Tax=Xylaria arbuscula TaxID=114810 RepID=A0A9W8NP99_9PEZI|nr:hypothetical protein NPX13_g12 [Xylaria arbuscula]
MKFLAALSVTTMFGGVLALRAPTFDFGNSLAGGFTSKCRSHSVAGDGLNIFLTSDCKGFGHEYHTAKLNLNHCLKNNKGTLHGFPAGGFAAICTDPRLQEGSATLLVECEKGVGWITTTFNLDEIVGSTDALFT